MAFTRAKITTMKRYWHIVAILLALVFGVVAFLWPGRSHEPPIAPPDAGDAMPANTVNSPSLAEPAETPPVSVDPEDAGLTQRAINARSVGDIDTAIALFEQAISADPADVVALSNYGRLLTLTFSLDRALEVLEAASDLQPSDAQVWLDLATAYERAQLFRDSREAQARAQALVGAEAITRDELGRFVVTGTRVP
jgi:Flp pilus assembly protein TadD